MAHWIVEDHGFGGQYYRCSNCRNVWNDIYEDVSSAEHCPSCGEVIDKNKAKYYEEPRVGKKDKPIITIGKIDKIKNGSKFFIGSELSRVELTLHQHFNWLQKLMWKWCFGVRVEDYSED